MQNSVKPLKARGGKGNYTKLYGLHGGVGAGRVHFIALCRWMGRNESWHWRKRTSRILELAQSLCGIGFSRPPVLALPKVSLSFPMGHGSLGRQINESEQQQQPWLFSDAPVPTKVRPSGFSLSGCFPAALHVWA